MEFSDTYSVKLALRKMGTATESQITHKNRVALISSLSYNKFELQTDLRRGSIERMKIVLVKNVNPELIMK